MNSIIDLLHKNINRGDIFAVSINEEEENFIRRINNPDLFREVQDVIEKLLEKNGQMHVHNLPEIILIISKVYNSHIIENCIDEIGIANIVKYTIHSILESKLFFMSDVEIKIIENVVDTSINLLAMNSSNGIKKDKDCCFNIFSSILMFI
jgi:hypothetical protein